jgi:16S rRNA (uracil1498-N3)-methyltransferase
VTRRRIIVEKLGPQGAILTGEQAHHLARVLRARLGEVYELSDQQSVWLARIVSLQPRRVEFVLVERIEKEPETSGATLLVAIFDFRRLEWALEKATELGVTEIHPLAASRSDKHLVKAAPARMARWEKILHATAQQSRRVTVPSLLPLRAFSDALAGITSETRILLSEAPSAPPFGQVLRAAAKPRAAALAIGPEGGWTAEERRVASRFGFVEASLGPRILRTETAVLAALAILSVELDVG